MRSCNLSEQRQQWLLAHPDKSLYCLYALIVLTTATADVLSTDAQAERLECSSEPV
jgi:hypothetical protein